MRALLLLPFAVCASLACAAPGRVTSGQWLWQTAIHDEPVTIQLDLDHGKAAVDAGQGVAETPLEKLEDGTIAVDFGFGKVRFEAVRGKDVRLCTIAAQPKCFALQAVSSQAGSAANQPAR